MPTPPIGAILDANTIALYRCDEATAASNLIDAGGNFDLTQTGSPVPRLPPFSSVAGGREVTAASQGFERSPVTGGVVSELAGECTLEFWVFWHGGPGLTGYLFPFSCQTPLPEGHTIFYVDVIPDTSAAPGAIRSVWNAGPNATNVQLFQSTNNFLTTNTLTHVAVRHRLVSGQRVVDFFKNGVLHSSSGLLPVPSTSFVGTAKLTAHTIGSDFWASYYSNGVIDDMRVSKIARSDAEILATYTNGVNSLPLGQWAKLGAFPGTSTDEVFVGLRAQLLGNGWTEVDVLAGSVPGARKVVFKGKERTVGLGDAPFVRIHTAHTQNPQPQNWSVCFTPYADWDTTTHVGMLSSGEIATNQGVRTWEGQGGTTYAIARVNSYSIAIHTNASFSGFDWAYIGFVKRLLPASIGGITKLSAGIAAGISVLPIALPITPYVGQKLQIMNFAHNSASPNATNVETVVVAAGSTPTTINIVGSTAFAYDIGALVGENVFPSIIWPGNTGVGYAAFDGNSQRGTSAGARLVMGPLSGTRSNWILGDQVSIDYTPTPNTYTGRLSIARQHIYTPYHSDGLEAHGTIGQLYHLLMVAKDAPDFGIWDKIEDVVSGERYWVIPSSNNIVGNVTAALGPGAPLADAGSGLYPVLVNDIADTDSGLPPPAVDNNPPPPPDIIITPSLVVYQASTRGENQFALLNTQISVLPLTDTFPGVTLDATKWINVSSGGGTVSVNNAAILSVPSTGGISSIRTVSSWNNFDVSARLAYNNAVDLLSPTGEIVHGRMRASIDASNYFDIEHIWDPTRGGTVRINVTTAGVVSLLSKSSTNSSSRTLRLVRFNGRILAYAGSNLLIDLKGWRSDLVKIELATSCTSSPLNLTTTFLDFVPKVLVTFGDNIAPQTTEIINRVVGTVPPAELPGLVEVVAHGAITSQTLGRTLEYVPPDQLSLDPNGVIVINNDDTIR